MKVSDFDYELPESLVAQEPLARRDRSRLLVLDRATGAIEHRVFFDLPDLLRPGDLVVLNDTKVVPARLRGRKPTGGEVELLLLERAGGSDAAPVWECLAHGSKPLRPGLEIELGEGFRALVLERRGEAWAVRLEDEAGAPVARLGDFGEMPLPPYIKRSPEDPRRSEDRERYQTVFASHPGAVAAPTAGLHFTPRILEAIASRGVELAYLTLHVGIGTFLPVRTDRVEDHLMHAERFELPDAAAAAVDRTKRAGGRVVAVGTTVLRTIETQATAEGQVRPGSGRSDLFIYPGFRFRVVDALITNFHLPRSTLLMLLCAFAGRENVLAAYREAIREGYRFYSYGDAMFVGSA